MRGWAASMRQPAANRWSMRAKGGPRLVTEEGASRGMMFQLTGVDKALGSVKIIARAGHRVVSDEDGPYIENNVTGETIWLRENDDTYALEAFAVPFGRAGRADGTGGGTLQAAAVQRGSPFAGHGGAQ